MFKKLFEKFFTKQNYRRSKREKVELVHDILLFVGDKSFKLIDLSLTGFAVKDEQKFQFVLNQAYEGTLEEFDRDRCPVKFKVVRIGNDIIGCDVIADAAYVDFFNEFKVLSLEVKVEERKKRLKVLK